MFDILVTIMGSLDEKDEAFDLVRDLEERVDRLRSLGMAVEVRGGQLAGPVYRRIIVPGVDREEA